MTDEPTLDPRKLEEMRELAGPDEPEFLSRLIRAFLESGHEVLERLREASHTDSVDEVRDAAHALKGSSGSVGATRLFALCDAVEEAAVAGTIDADGVAAITVEFGQVERALREEFGLG